MEATNPYVTVQAPSEREQVGAAELPVPTCPISEPSAGLICEGTQWLSKQRSLRVVYVLNDSPKSAMGGSPESGALHCLRRACEGEGAHLSIVNFGELDFGETAVLDTFYDAGQILFI
ncbi:mitogen-activated protein kinase kinase kinase 15-like isoform X2 [Xenopus laevis]|uniref:Mitogen-activated protein kinase kinase kinase 15-like n=1 Tax=Xenopus laevis TaxID=8355 RepID=A0A8J1ME33_XENLA|nr:mitogen-activated protein kinase kinase kinase 15-like isoform X2 [Xenopus laevis]XP_041439976.1 mitogen-activated protein kinase kinase kinase 15-like [Xenopus laevis]XP_041439978.1 mitogen-activated protein kinase kinase kinase 15-like isoform X2 [Xenopus laevis]